MRIAPFVLCVLGLVPVSAPGEKPGIERGVTLLPNGWRIKPAGRHITVGDLPLALAESPDGRFVIVSNNGYEKPTLTVVDLEGLVVRQTRAIDNAWLGLEFDPAGERIFSSGGNANALDVLPWSNARLGTPSQIRLGEKLAESFLGGLAVAPDGKRLFVVDPLGLTLAAVDLSSSRLEKTVPLPAEPYTCLLSPDGGTLYVSLWGGAKVMAFDAATLELRREIPTGEHPNAMVLSRDGARLFVACANTNAVWAVDLEPGRAAEQISVALYPKAPEGSTPNAVGLSPDGKTLLVANADNNAIAVVDVSRAGSSHVEGFIPSGWYPTAARFTRDSKRILILSGKGLTSQANPRGPQPGIPGAPSQYAGALLRGALSILPAPSAKQLAAYTRTVYALTPYRDADLLAPAKAPAGSPVPQRVGRGSPIRHVFYVIRENRTYDQMLGDLARGNGDPNLCLFGEDVTPNAHALASDFVLLDNFYVNAEVSHTGHAFSTGAYATDVTEKVWPINYAERGGKYISEGGGGDRNAYGNVSAPAAGYIWDACRRAGVSVRSYGEFAVGHKETELDRAGEPPYVGSVPGLKGLVCPDYPPYDLSIPDGRRVDVWLEEFRRFEREGILPRLSIIRLGNDHTVGTKAGGLTPRSMIAENDEALGRIVEAISQSSVWKESAVFILEDDAQNGPDHVDAHRSVALVASPFARRGAVDSTLYTTCGVLRTIELLLGLPPMSQCDAAATPMYRAFQAASDLRPYARRQARVPTDEKNAPEAFGAQASALMDFSQPDRAPERALNEILWKSVKGAASPLPPPVRAAFVRPVEPAEDRNKDDD
jgi:DNA-binding beta-propeller fold protein YncE